MKTHEQQDCTMSSLTLFLKGEMFNAFVKVIPNFYICKANVEFTIVRFDGIKSHCLRKPGRVKRWGSADFLQINTI